MTGDARPVATPPAQATPPPTLARAEWEHIQRILADTGGNVSEAARRLGITRRTLQLKLKKYPPAHLIFLPLPLAGERAGVRASLARDERAGVRALLLEVPAQNPGQDRLSFPVAHRHAGVGGRHHAGDDVGADDVLPVGDVAVLQQRPVAAGQALVAGDAGALDDRLDVRVVGRGIGQAVGAFTVQTSGAASVLTPPSVVWADGPQPAAIPIASDRSGAGDALSNARSIEARTLAAPRAYGAGCEKISQRNIFAAKKRRIADEVAAG